MAGNIDRFERDRRERNPCQALYSDVSPEISTDRHRPLEKRASERIPMGISLMICRADR